MLKKFLGAISFIIGLLLVLRFPFAHPTYQPYEMQRAGILIGIVLIGIGLLLMKI